MKKKKILSGEIKNLVIFSFLIMDCLVGGVLENAEQIF